MERGFLLGLGLGLTHSAAFEVSLHSNLSPPPSLCSTPPPCLILLVLYKTLTLYNLQDNKYEHTFFYPNIIIHYSNKA